MCCSQKALKILLYFSCVLILGIGSVLIWVGYLVQASAFVSILKYTYTGYVVVACGGYLIFLSFFGLIGAWKQHRCLLGTYIIFTVVVGILLICFGSVLIYLRSVSEDYLNSQESCLEHFYKADNVSDHASEVFCTLYCPCSLNAAKLDIEIDEFYRGSADNVMECDPCELASTYSADEQVQLIIWANETLNIDLNGTNCSISSSTFESNYFSNKEISYFPLLTWIEEKFDCSGLCTQHKLLMFSDVNVAKPEKACYSSLNNWAKRNFLNYGIISIVLGTFQLIIISFAFALCCCSKTANLQPVETKNKVKASDDKNIGEDLDFESKENRPNYNQTLELADLAEVELNHSNDKSSFKNVEVMKKGKIKTPYSLNHRN